MACSSGSGSLNHSALAWPQQGTVRVNNVNKSWRPGFVGTHSHTLQQGYMQSETQSSMVIRDSFKMPYPPGPQDTVWNMHIISVKVKSINNLNQLWISTDLVSAAFPLGKVWEAAIEQLWGSLIHLLGDYLAPSVVHPISWWLVEFMKTVHNGFI